MAKAKQRFSWAYNHETRTVSVTDDVTGDIAEFSLENYPVGIQERIEVYGLGKLLQDRNSQVAADGKMKAFAALDKQFIDGEWKAERQAGSRFLPAVISAIAKRKGCSEYAAQVAYRALDDDGKAAIKVALAKDIQAIEAARAKQDEVSLDDLI